MLWDPLVQAMSSPSEKRFCNWSSGMGDAPPRPRPVRPVIPTVPSATFGWPGKNWRAGNESTSEAVTLVREKDTRAVLTMVGEKMCFSSVVANWLSPRSSSGSKPVFPPLKGKTACCISVK